MIADKNDMSILFTKVAQGAGPIPAPFGAFDRH